MADEKHEDKKPETAKPTEVIGEQKTKPTTAPTTAHPASVRPAPAPSTSIASSPSPAAAPPIASAPELSRRMQPPRPRRRPASTPPPNYGAKQNVSKKSSLNEA
jgi:hypothetical protein